MSSIRVYLRDEDGEITCDESYFVQERTIERVEQRIRGPLGGVTICVEFDPPLIVPRPGESSCGVSQTEPPDRV